MTIVAQLVNIARPITKTLDYLTPVLLLGARLWVANVFFKSGLVKIQSFESTIFLFDLPDPPDLGGQSRTLPR